MLYWRWFNRPRHPMLRLLLGAIGVVLLVGILMLGFFALIAFAFIGGIVALVRALTRSYAQGSTVHSGGEPQVIEGEFVVVHRDPTALNHR